jgi:PAS domain S-box-containing protein
MEQTVPPDVQNVSADIELNYRRYLVKVVMVLALPLLVGFTVYDILIERYLVALILFLMLSIISFLYFLVKKPILKTKEDLIYRYFFTLFFILLGIYLGYTIGVEGKLSRIPWAFLFPVVIFFALGEIKALIWVTLLYAVLLFLGIQFSTTEQIATGELKFRFYLSFSFVILFSYLFERLKRNYHRELIDNQRDLKNSENLYREAYENLRNEIKERKRAEKARRQSEERFREITENIREVFWLFDWKKQRVLYCSPAYEGIWGRSLKELYDKYNEWADSIHPDDLEYAQTSFRKILETGGGEPREYRIVRPDETIRWVSDRGFAIKNSAGEVIRIAGIAEDITERKITEEAYRKSEERYRAVVEDMPAMICRFLPDGTLTFVNDAYCKYFATNRDSIIGQNFFQFIPEQEREKVRNTFLSLNKDKSTITYEHQVLGPDGKILWQEWTDRALFDEQGNITEYQSIGQDITERKMAEEELIRSEARLKEAQKIAHVGDWTLNVETGKASWSEELRRIMGIGPQVEASPKTLLSLVHPADKKIIEQGMKDALEKDEPYNAEYRLIRTDGVERILHSRARVSRSEDGRPLRMVGIAQDITEQRRIEAELKEAYDIINESPAVVFLWKNQKGWPVEFVSENVKTLFGYTAEELISGMIPYRETVHPDDLDRVAKEVASFSADPGRERFTHTPYRVVCKNGQVKWVDDRTYIRRDDHGNITHYQGIVLDVTASKEAEEALKESEEKFRNLAEQSPNMIFINKLGNVVYANKRCEEVIGYQREQFYSPDFDFFSLIAPESMETIKTMLKKHMAGEEVKPYEYSIINKTGKRIEAINTTKWIDYGGDRAILGIVTDITERKRLEQEREGLIAELEAKNAELERFTYSVSHDLKSPLITIKGFLGMLEQDAAKGDTEKLKSDIARIANATDQMKILLDELLQLSRIGRLVNPPEEISLEHLAHETMESLSGIINDKGVTVDISPDLPAILGDRTRLLEVYQNMMENAVKFMGDQPKPRIEVGARRDNGDTVFYIKDNGMGIDSRYQDKIFGLFEKLDSEVEGTGVGLALAQRIIELHGGRIWVESEGPGKGSTFCFTLPSESQRR